MEYLGHNGCRQLGRHLTQLHCTGWKQKAYTSLFIALALIGCSSGSSDSPAQPTSTSANDETTIPASLPFGGDASATPMSERIATQMSLDNQEGWACISETGKAYVYSFFEKGGVAGFADSQLGFEIELNAETVDSTLETQLTFSWQQQNEDSLLIDVADQGLKISLNNIRFTENNEMTAYSSLRGLLYCALQSDSTS